MIQTDKETAIVLKDPTPRLQEWIETREGFTIKIGDGNPRTDFAFVRNKKKNANSTNVAAIRPEQYNKQQNWFKAGKSLKDWPGNLYHLNNPLLAAIWACGKAGINKILFAEIRPRNIIEQKYRRNQFKEVANKLIKEFDIKIQYNDKRAQIFSEIGERFSVEDKEEEKDPIDLPNTESLFANRFEKDWTDLVSTATVRYEPNIVGTVVELDNNRTLTSTSAIPYDRNRVEGEGILLLDETKALETLNTYGNFKEIYLVNPKVQEKLAEVKQEYLADENISVLIQTFLALSIGGNFEVKVKEETKERIGETKKEFLNRVREN